MPLYFWISFAVLSTASLFSLRYFYKQADHVIKRHIHIVGHENSEVIKTRRLRLLLFFYVISIPSGLFAFFFFFYPFS